MKSSASRRARVLLIAAIFGIIAAACGGGTADTAATTSDAIAAQNDQAVGDAPAAQGGVLDGNFIDLNGETVDLASYEGQDIVLWYWAPW